MVDLVNFRISYAQSPTRVKHNRPPHPGNPLMSLDCQPGKLFRPKNLVLRYKNRVSEAKFASAGLKSAPDYPDYECGGKHVRRTMGGFGTVGHSKI